MRNGLRMNSAVLKFGGKILVVLSLVVFYL
jgi:hypothetical protein